MAAIGNGSGLKRARYSGPGSLTFSIDRLGTPCACRVILFDRTFGIPVARIFSDSNGDVTVGDLTNTANTFFVVAFDTVAGGEAPAISDFLVTE